MASTKLCIFAHTEHSERVLAGGSVCVCVVSCYLCRSPTHTNSIELPPSKRDQAESDWNQTHATESECHTSRVHNCMCHKAVVGDNNFQQGEKKTCVKGFVH